MLPAEKVIAEHYRLGSTKAILSRSFCNANELKDIEAVDALFKSEILKIREYEKVVEKYSDEEFMANHREVERIVNDIICAMRG